MEKITNICIDNYPKLIPCEGIKEVMLNPEVTGGISYSVSIVFIESRYMNLIRDCTEVFVDKTIIPKNDIEWIFWDKEEGIVSIVHPRFRTIPIG